MNFKDQVVVITVGTSGIGKQAAIEFSKKGAHVVALTVDKEEVCKEAIKEIGNDASYIHCDVSKESDVKKAIDEVVLIVLLIMLVLVQMAYVCLMNH